MQVINGKVKRRRWLEANISRKTLSDEIGDLFLNKSDVFEGCDNNKKIIILKKMGAELGVAKTGCCD